MTLWRSIVFPGLLALAAGCADVPKAPNIAQVPIVDGGVPLSAPYRLTAGDEIAIRFRYYADMNDSALIGPDGRATLNLVKDVSLAGLTVPQADDLLDTRYTVFVKEPKVDVTIKTYALQQVFVTGQVQSPGLQRSTIPLTASRAIAMAGGFRTTAAETHDVLLVRRAADGSVIYYQLDLGDAGATPGQDPVLQSFDLIYVPETRIAQVADFISANILRMLPVSASYQATQAIP